MATNPAILGYSILYDKGGSRQIFNMYVPFQEVRPARAPTSKSRWSLDGLVKEVRRFGTGLNDAIVRIRWDNEPQKFVDALTANIEEGLELWYVYRDPAGTNIHSLATVVLPPPPATDRTPDFSSGMTNPEPGQSFGFPFQIVEPETVGAIIEFDEFQKQLGENLVTLRIRRTDEGSFRDIFFSRDITP